MSAIAEVYCKICDEPIQVRYDEWPASGDGWNEPREPAWVEVWEIVEQTCDHPCESEDFQEDVEEVLDWERG